MSILLYNLFKELLCHYLTMDDLTILYIVLIIFFGCGCFISVFEHYRNKNRRNIRLKRVVEPIILESIIVEQVINDYETTDSGIDFKESELREREIV
jgi:hypothetical protein